MKLPEERTQHRILIGLLTVCIIWFWLLPLPSSLWVDEGVTSLVVHFPHHPSFGAAPQVPQSLYYWLPRFAGWLIGDTSGGDAPSRPLEIAYRIPSMLAMALALWLMSKLAARLLHPEAGWFTVFACLTLTGINYEALDARPYALGICLSAAAIFFEVRWFDFARPRDALLFITLAALLWPVHLVYWPFYPVFAIYAVSRFAARDTPVRKSHAAIAFAVLGAALLPVARNALVLASQAGAHVITYPPGLHTFEHQLRWNLVLLAGAGAWACSRWLNWPRQNHLKSSLPLVLAWWLTVPVLVFVYSRASGNSLYIPRYLSLMLPGVALATTAVVAYWVPSGKWKLAAMGMAVAALVSQGHWTGSALRHEESDWRAASAEINRFAADGSTHVICISPFIEARTPVWTPEYQLPGFLYAHIYPYPVHTTMDLFPYVRTDALPFAKTLAHDVLPGTNRFAIYGVFVNAQYWLDWFRSQPQFAQWNVRTLGYGYVQVTELWR